MADTILVIYDGTTSGDEGIRPACALAESEGQPIDIVSVSLVHPTLHIAHVPPRGYHTSHDPITEVERVLHLGSE